MFPVLGSFQGHLSPHAQAPLRRKPCASVCVCVGVSVFVSAWVCAWHPVAELGRPLLLRGCGPGAALRAVAQQWLFLRPLCFVRARRVVASLDLQGSSLFACSPGWRVPGSFGLMCVPCLHELLVPCRVPSATHRPVTIRVATEKSLEKQAKGVGGGHGRDPYPSPSSPLPKHTNKCFSPVG